MPKARHEIHEIDEEVIHDIDDQLDKDCEVTALYAEHAETADDEEFFSMFAKDIKDYCDEEVEYLDLCTEIEQKGWIHSISW